MVDTEWHVERNDTEANPSGRTVVTIDFDAAAKKVFAERLGRWSGRRS